MLSLIQQHLQAIYRIEDAPDVRQFLIPREGVEQLLGPDARPAEEWVLVHEDEDDDALDIGVYIDEEHLGFLEGMRSPAEALHEGFHAFCVATEGVSHFLLLHERARRNQAVCMLELEAQAEVDKFVSARLHLPERSREWLARLFRRAELAPGLSADERQRYREAARMAQGFCQSLDVNARNVQELLDALRAFWRRSRSQRLDELRRHAA